MSVAPLYKESMHKESAFPELAPGTLLIIIVIY